MEDNIQVEKDLKEVADSNEIVKSEGRTDISPERIERMKKAFKPTWLQEQINSPGKASNGKKQ